MAADATPGLTPIQRGDEDLVARTALAAVSNDFLALASLGLTEASTPAESTLASNATPVAAVDGIVD